MFPEFEAPAIRAKFRLAFKFELLQTAHEEIKEVQSVIIMEYMLIAKKDPLSLLF